MRSGPQINLLYSIALSCTLEEIRLFERRNADGKCKWFRDTVVDFLKSNYKLIIILTQSESSKSYFD